jgi:integrase
LQTERLVPIDWFVCRIVHRLRTLRSQDSSIADGFLLARPRCRYTLGYYLRTSFHEIAAAVGIKTRVVPHQFRHYAAGRTMPPVSMRTAVDRLAEYFLAA